MFQEKLVDKIIKILEIRREFGKSGIPEGTVLGWRRYGGARSGGTKIYILRKGGEIEVVNDFGDAGEYGQNKNNLRREEFMEVMVDEENCLSDLYKRLGFEYPDIVFQNICGKSFATLKEK